MDVIAIVNQKGGCAKTTTVMNLGAVLGAGGKRVLMVDLDPQASLTKSLGVREAHNLFTDGLRPLPTKLTGVDLVPGGPGLVRHEMALTVREDFSVLQQILSTARGYDYLLLDCPPNLYGSTTNAIVAADRLLIPAPLDVSVLQSLSDTKDLLASLAAKGLSVPVWVAGVVTIYRKLSVEPQLLRLAQAVLPELLETRIRMSTLYPRAGLKQTAAAIMGARTSAPMVDHRSLAVEMGLL